MSGFASLRLDWTEIYDVGNLLQGFEFDDTNKKLLVDIGGSRKCLLHCVPGSLYIPLP